MDLVLNGRGARITDRIREVARQKLSRLERMEPRVTRLQVEIISERNPRLGGAHRVEAAFDTPRRTFRAHADAPDVEAAFDVLVEKLERQIRDHREKRRAKLIAGATRVKSAGNERAPE
ncbi:MAG: ribosomal subunit interface protein [Actinomycetota bacterium]|nr:MAG: ribosomal subunit interface protein [Actinomycetota bacterium]